MKSFSVIIPVYNTPEELFRNCIASLLNQNYENIELIVVNDGSNESTSRLFREISKSDERIKLIEQENKGVSSARNNGIKNCSGDFVTFVDSDDTLSPGFFSYFNEVLKDEEITIFGVNLVYPSKTIPGKILDLDLSEKDKDSIVRGLLSRDTPVGSIVGLDGTCGKIYKTSFLKQYNLLFNEKLRRHEDSLFCLNAFYNMQKGKAVNFHGYNYIYNPKSICQRFDSGVFKDTEYAIGLYKKYVEEKYRDSEEIWNAFYYKIVDIIMSDCDLRYFNNKDNKAPFRKRKQEFAAYIEGNTLYKEAFCNVKSRFPVSFYSFCVRHGMTKFMFSIFSKINAMIRFFITR